MQVLGGSSNSSALLECIGHGTRFRTISKRVAAWRKAAQYFTISFGHPWPSDIPAVLSWLRLLREEFSWSALQSSWEALGFMEKAGGVPAAVRLGNSPVLISFLKEAALSHMQAVL